MNPFSRTPEASAPAPRGTFSLHVYQSLQRLVSVVELNDPEGDRGAKPVDHLEIVGEEPLVMLWK